MRLSRPVRNAFFYFRFDAERVYIGTRIVNTTITLSEDGTRYEGAAEAQNFGTAGNLLGTFRGTDIGQRLF